MTLPLGGVKVHIEEGVYAPISLNISDSGKPDSQIEYIGYGSVTVSAGVALPMNMWKSISPFAGTLPTFQFDLSAVGITDVGEMVTGGLGDCQVGFVLGKRGMRRGKWEIANTCTHVPLLSLFHIVCFTVAQQAGIVLRRETHDSLKVRVRLLFALSFKHPANILEHTDGQMCWQMARGHLRLLCLEKPRWMQSHLE